MTLEQQWLEYDFNPFILFNKEGKIISLNSEAQFLLSSATSKELFDIALAYASVSFGFKTTFLNLEFGRYKFFGITVGYIDEEEIGLKLYRTPTLNVSVIDEPTSKELINIYSVIELCISSNSIDNEINFIKDFDPAIPDIILDSNKFVKILNQIYKCFLNNKKITTKVFYRIGEYIKSNDKKYSLFSIKVSADYIDENHLKELYKLLNNANYYTDIKENSITINLPVITS